MRTPPTMMMMAMTMVTCLSPREETQGQGQMAATQMPWMLLTAQDLPLMTRCSPSGVSQVRQSSSGTALSLVRAEPAVACLGSSPCDVITAVAHGCLSDGCTATHCCCGGWGWALNGGEGGGTSVVQDEVEQHTAGKHHAEDQWSAKSALSCL